MAAEKVAYEITNPKPEKYEVKLGEVTLCFGVAMQPVYDTRADYSAVLSGGGMRIPPLTAPRTRRTFYLKHVIVGETDLLATLDGNSTNRELRDSPLRDAIKRADDRALDPRSFEIEELKAEVAELKAKVNAKNRRRPATKKKTGANK